MDPKSVSFPTYPSTAGKTLWPSIWGKILWNSSLLNLKSFSNSVLKVTGNLTLALWEEAWTQDKTRGNGVFVLVKEVPFHQGQVGSRCSSSLAKCVTPSSHQHPMLCDPPSHGATRPAVLPGPGQWLQCPVHCPASCFAAGMPCPTLVPLRTQPYLP